MTKNMAGQWICTVQETGERLADCEPRAVEGWVVDWCVNEQSWCWRSVATGEVLCDAPAVAGGESVDDLAKAVKALQRAGHVARDARVSRNAFRKCYLRYAQANHPDKVKSCESAFTENLKQLKAVCAFLDLSGKGLEWSTKEESFVPVLSLIHISEPTRPY